MIGYVLRRLLAAIPTLLAVLTLVFVIVRIVPGDPAMAILGDQATPSAVAALHVRLGLDRPIWLQYLDFLRQSLAGDFGRSMVTGRSVLGDVAAVLPNTLDLALASVLVGVAVGVPAGVYAAVYRNRFIDVAGPARLAVRAVAAGLRLRHLPAAAVRAALAAVPGDRRRQPVEPGRPALQAGAARDDAGAGDGRLHHPRDPLRHAAGAAGGFHPHGAGQGRAAAPASSGGMACAMPRCRS